MLTHMPATTLGTCCDPCQYEIILSIALVLHEPLPLIKMSHFPNAGGSIYFFMGALLHVRGFITVYILRFFGKSFLDHWGDTRGRDGTYLLPRDPSVLCYTKIKCCAMMVILLVSHEEIAW